MLATPEFALSEGDAQKLADKGLAVARYHIPLAANNYWAAVIALALTLALVYLPRFNAVQRRARAQTPGSTPGLDPGARETEQHDMAGMFVMPMPTI